MKVVVVIPVYNEEENLKILIPQLFSVVSRLNLIVVDDNSSDGTTNLLKEFSKKYKLLKHLKRKQKMGRGSAVLHGFTYAYKKLKCDVFVEMDADLSHNPEELPRLVNAVDINKFVIASRYLKRSKIVDIPFKRRLLSKMANKFNSLLFGLTLKDITNGYRAYPRRAIEHLLKHSYISSGFVVLAESTYLLHASGFKIQENPTVFINRRIGGSKADFHEVYISIRDMLKIRFQIH